MESPEQQLSEDNNSTEKNQSVSVEDLKKELDAKEQLIQKLENEKKSVSEAQSGKDKSINELKKELDTFKNKYEMQNKIASGDYPDAVKKALYENIDGLNQDNFESFSTQLKTVYDSGQAAKIQQQTDAINTKPKGVESLNLEEKLAKAKTPKEYEDIAREAGVL